MRAPRSQFTYYLLTLLKSRACHNNRYPGGYLSLSLTHTTHTHTPNKHRPRKRMLGSRQEGKDREAKIPHILLTLQITKGSLAQKISLTCREREKKTETHHVQWVSLAQRPHVTCWTVALGSFLTPLTGDDWMSIFGHVGALLDGLCLIMQRLVSAGCADGHNSSVSTLLINRAIRTDTTGQTAS